MFFGGCIFTHPATYLSAMNSLYIGNDIFLPAILLTGTVFAVGLYISHETRMPLSVNSSYSS